MTTSNSQLSKKDWHGYLTFWENCLKTSLFGKILLQRINYLTRDVCSSISFASQGKNLLGISVKLVFL